MIYNQAMGKITINRFGFFIKNMIKDWILILWLMPVNLNNIKRFSLILLFLIFGINSIYWGLTSLISRSENLNISDDSFFILSCLTIIIVGLLLFISIVLVVKKIQVKNEFFSFIFAFVGAPIFIAGFFQFMLMLNIELWDIVPTLRISLSLMMPGALLLYVAYRLYIEEVI